MREFDAEYRGKCRFLVDESIGEAVAKILQTEGYNTKYVSNVGLVGRSDEDVFARAWKENRIVVTHDLDFLDDRRFPPNRNPGVILIRPGSSGNDSHGLFASLRLALLIAGDNADWLRGKKLDFTSTANLTRPYLSLDKVVSTTVTR
jgi:predicted nuclease of predicted toxin-antitoxin system